MQRGLDNSAKGARAVIKKINILGALLIIVGSNYASAEGASQNFLHGAQNTACMSFQEANAGRTIKLIAPTPKALYPKELRFQGGQANLQVLAIFASGERASIAQDFDVGYDADGLEKETNTYCAGQFDFDKDGMPELLLSVVAPEQAGMTGASVNVFRYFPPLRERDAARPQNWQLVGKLTAIDVVGDATIKVKDASITIPRNVRGFYHEVSWVKNKFVDTSDY